MITYPTKQIGDAWTAVNANEVKTVVNSLFTPFINYFDFSSDAVTAVAEADTYYKLNTTTTQGFKRGDLVHSNNRITYTGATTAVFSVQGIVSLESGNNKQIHVAFFQNEVIKSCSEQQITTSGAGKASNISFQCLAELAQNDYIEVFVENATSADNITLDNLNVIVKQL
jgi:hypothetical protein